MSTLLLCSKGSEYAAEGLKGQNSGAGPQWFLWGAGIKSLLGSPSRPIPVSLCSILSNLNALPKEELGLWVIHEDNAIVTPPLMAFRKPQVGGLVLEGAWESAGTGRNGAGSWCCLQGLLRGWYKASQLSESLKKFPEIRVTLSYQTRGSC